MKQSTLLLCLLCAAQPLAASSLVTVFNDYGTGSPFDPTSGDTVTNGSNDLSTSFAFTVPGIVNLALNQILFTAAIGASDTTNSVTLSIETNNGGKPGTQVFTSGAITGQMGVLGSGTNPPVTIDYTSVSGSTALLAGATYWLTLDAPTTTHVTWDYGNGNVDGNEAFEQNGSWTLQSSREYGAFEIIASTPEPGTMTLLAGGLCLIMFGCQRRLAPIRSIPTTKKFGA
jgi:hypothetical protein